MLRVIIIIFFSWWCVEVAAQNVTIPKSTDIVVIKGKSYYLHTVQPGQTLYSICKAYGLNVEEVKLMNDKKDNNLSLYEVLKLPFVEPFVRQDGKFWYHKVAQGETLYSIARFYAIKPKRLLKYNSEYSHNEPLSIGAVIKLPLNEIDRSVLNPRQQQIVVPESSLTEEETIPEEKKIIVEEEKVIVNTSSKSSETKKQLQEEIVLVKSQEEQQEKIEMPEYISEVIMPANPFVKIALLLPFSAKEYPYYMDSTSVYQSVSISARSEQFIGFYEGVLLAVDSLKKQGVKIDLRVFDTERSTEKMYGIVEEVNQWQPDLVLGPVYGSVYKIIAENLEDKTIPLVYPLSSRSENFGEFPNFVQVNASFETLAVKMTDWLKEQGKEANLVHICLKGPDASETADRQIFKEQMEKIEGMRFFNWDVEQVPLDSLRTLLLSDRENILVLPVAKEAEVSKILPLLSALTDAYRITVVGLPEWQTFTSVDHETYYKLNTKIFSYSYIDYFSDAATEFAVKYRKYFYTEPGSLVFKAFDMGMYFIDLAARYRDRALDAILYYNRDGSFSKFHFGKMMNGAGKENQGFFIVNYSSDYQLKMESF